MSRKKPPAKAPPKPTTPPNNTLSVQKSPGADRATMLARVALRANVRAAVTTASYAKPQLGDLDFTALAEELASQSKAVVRGDMRGAEEMLFAQAHTLQALFHELARRAGLNMGEYLDAADRYMRLALRAQNQCRSTLETLALLKNPPNPTFIRQANVAHGPQQVNNGTPAPTVPARALETENPQNRLLEAQGHDDRLDTLTPSTASGADPAMATLGAVDGTKDGSR